MSAQCFPDRRPRLLEGCVAAPAKLAAYQHTTAACKRELPGEDGAVDRWSSIRRGAFGAVRGRARNPLQVGARYQSSRRQGDLPVAFREDTMPTPSPSSPGRQSGFIESGGPRRLHGGGLLSVAGRSDGAGQPAYMQCTGSHELTTSPRQDFAKPMRISTRHKA